MEVRLAKTAGFCFGVKRAVETVYEQAQKRSDVKIYTYGPIIHNEEVVKDMRSKGVEVIYTQEELMQLQSGVVIILSRCRKRNLYDLRGTRLDLCRCNLSVRKKDSPYC